MQLLSLLHIVGWKTAAGCPTAGLQAGPCCIEETLDVRLKLVVGEDSSGMLL